jgi:cytochrome bd-type quinol oxidase subunit 1
MGVPAKDSYLHQTLSQLMTGTGPYRKAPSSIVPPQGSEAIAAYGRSAWRTRIGVGVLMVAVSLILLSALFYAEQPSEWLPDLYLASFGVLLIVLVFLVSWLMRPRRHPPR